MQSKAERDIAREREKQRRKWSPSHDEKHTPKVLANVAAWLVQYVPPTPCGCREAMCPHVSIREAGAPDWVLSLAQRHDRRERLVIAAALLIAELDVMDDVEVSNA